MPGINKLKVGYVYVDEASKYNNLLDKVDSSIFFIKDTGLFVGDNIIANYSGSETDPTVPSYVKTITETDISTWNHKVDASLLAEVAFNGDYDYLTNRPTIPSELADLEDDTTHRVVTDASIDDWNSKTSNEGTITGIILNSSNMGTSGVIDLGTVLTEHQSLDNYYTKTILDASFVQWNKTYLDFANIHLIDPDRIQFLHNSSPYYLYVSNSGFVLEQGGTADLEWKIPFTGGDSKTVAFTSNIPTKLSLLTNDAGYALDASVVNLNKVPYVTETAAASVTIEPYKMYDFGTVSTAMVIVFDTTKEVTGYTKEYIIRFVAGTGCAVSLPNGVLYANGAVPTYIAGHTYEINIVNGCAVVAEFY